MTLCSNFNSKFFRRMHNKNMCIFNLNNKKKNLDFVSANYLITSSNEIFIVKQHFMESIDRDVRFDLTHHTSIFILNN